MKGDFLMKNLMTVANIRGYVDEHGTAMLNAEDVARGWGFIGFADFCISPRCALG